MRITHKGSARAIGAMVLLAWFCASPVWADSDSIIWQRADGPWGGAVRALAIDPQKANIVYAGTTCGVYRSNDSGGHWTQVGAQEISCQDIRALAIDLADPQIVYAAGQRRSLSQQRRRRSVDPYRSRPDRAGRLRASPRPVVAGRVVRCGAKEASGQASITGSIGLRMRRHFAATSSGPWPWTPPIRDAYMREPTKACT